MSDIKIEFALLPIIRMYGFERVHQTLHEIRNADNQCANLKQRKPSLSDHATKPTKKKASPTASEYVSKMQMPPEKESALLEIASRFQDKTFLPTSGEISNFCRIHSIDEPASKSRSNFIPRIFKFIATMELDDIQKILDDQMFSGPSRLGPIADAIRNNGRASHRDFK